MATTTSSSHVKQIKATSAERINGKVKLQNNKADGSGNATPVNGTVSSANGGQATTISTGKGGASTNGTAGEGLSPEQRRRISGRPQMTTEEQRQAVRKKVELFIPTINVRNSTTNILAKYKDAAPSLIIHLHPTHFRFDQQDGVFSYNSPMKALLEYIRDEQIPHEVADLFKIGRTKFYDACLIVEVRDHRPRGQSTATTSRGGPFITPSQNPSSTPVLPPASAASKEPPRIYKTLLRPTEQSLWQDFGQLADTSGGEFTDWMGLQVEGGLMLAMHPRLVLDTQRPGTSRKRIFERVCDQSGTIPPRKKVKRESSKAADDSAERAAEEKMMLLGDLKHDKDFQPRFQILVHKEEWKKKQAEIEKTKAAAGTPGAPVSMFNVAEAAKPNKATIESIQAQHQAQNLQQAQLAGQVLRPPTANGIGPNPAQLASQAAQQGALAAAQAQQNPQPPGAQRRPLPRNSSQDQLAQRAQQGQNLQRQLQPTGSNAPTPMTMSSSPQVPIQRLPAAPRNIPGTPRQPGTPQPQSAQVKHPTPQPNGQAMTPVSSQPSPMMKSSSQSDEGQQVNGTRAQFPRGPQGQMLNGVPQARPPAPQLQLPLPIAQFLETIKMLSNGQMSMTYEQFLGLPNPHQVQLIQKVQEYVQRRLAQQGGGQPGNQQTVQGAYAQAFLQQAQRNAAMPIQPGQTMTPDQQRLFAQTRQQLLGSADPELLRQQLAQQGRLPPNEVQAKFQQQLLARQQQPQQQSPQLQQQANLAQARQLAALQQQAQAAAAVPKMPNGNTMTPQQVQIFRARHLQAQAQARAQAQQAAQNINAPTPVQQFMNAMSPEQRAQFQGLDGTSQNQVYSQWVAKQQQMAAHQQQQQQQQQQQVQQGTPQLQYNPMAAQNMGATRMPVGPGMMMGQNGQVPTANGVGTTMMRQSTSGGGS